MKKLDKKGVTLMKTKDTIRCVDGTVKTIVYPDDYPYTYNKFWTLVKREYIPA